MRAQFEKVTAPGQTFLVKERIDRHFAFSWHFHPEMELTYIAQGQGQRFVGDSIEPYEAGDLILLGPNLPHTWASRPGPNPRKDRHYSIYAQFLPEFLGAGSLKLPEFAPIARLVERSAEGLRLTGRTRQEVAARMKPLFEAAGFGRLMLLLEILGVIAASRETRPLASKAYGLPQRPFDERRIDAVCRFINENYTRAIGQSEAAARAHLSVSAFSRFFKRSLGRGFVEYVNELRVSHACRLLVDTDKSVAEIAFASGFENLSNFNRRFRDLKRLNPRDYRKRFVTPG